MRARLRFLVAALLLSSCSGGTFVTVTLQSSGVTLSGVTRIDLDLQLAGKSASAKLTGNISFPTTTVLDIASGEGMLQITANAVDGSGHIMAQTAGTATVTRGKTTTATLDFGTVAAGPDMAGGGCSVCDPAASCSIDNAGAVTCACPSGYTGDGHTCSDIDECATGGGATCDTHASCTNTTGGYTCSCNAGFGGTGFICTPIWVTAHDVPTFSIGRGGAVGSGNTLYFFSPNGAPAMVKFQSWDVTTGVAGTITNETTMPVGSNDFCDCGNQSKLLANNGTLYYFGDHGQSYNTSTKTWTTISTYVAPTDHRRGETGIVILNNLVYWMGDRTLTASVQTYDVNTGTFATSTSYPIGIDNSGAAVVNGKIYSFSGTTTGSISTSTNYVFDPGTSMWTQKANMPTSVYYPDTVGFRNQVWGLYNGRLYIYDPATNLWSNGPILPAGGSNWHMAVVGSSTPALYILGDFSSGTMTIYQYNQ